MCNKEGSDCGDSEGRSRWGSIVFDLKTRLAGDILQKFINYRVKVAIVGDFSGYSSRSLQALIFESNSGNDIFFVPTEQQAIEKLSMLKQN